MSKHHHDSFPVVVGFGDNYFQNMGPAIRTELPIETLETTTAKATSETTATTTTTTTTSDTTVTAYQLYHTQPQEQEQQEKGQDENDTTTHNNGTTKEPIITPLTPWDEDTDSLIDVQCTITSSIFLTKSGKVYTCGTLHGQIKPQLTRTIITLPLKCVQISAGRHFCLARMEGGLAVTAWGAGHFGQLGLGNDSSSFIEHPTVIDALLPHVVGSPISNITTGYWHSMVVTQSGLVFAFGCNRNGQCGVKPTKEPPTICTPQLVKFINTTTGRSTTTTTASSANSTSSSSASSYSSAGKGIKIEKIVAGRSHSVALDHAGQVYCWGANQYGQCAVMSRRRGGVATPKHVEALAKVRIVDMSAGEAHTLALTGGGRVFGWGGGYEGQLGTGSIVVMNPKPKLVGDLDFIAIEAGREWKNKQKHHQQQENKTSSQQESSSSSAQTLANIPRIISITAKGNSSIAVSNFGHVYAWGCNDVGNLGLPKPDLTTLTYVDQGQPMTKTSTLRQFHTFSFDSSHNIALPQRLDSIRHFHVTSVGSSPTFLWCLGSPRQGKDDPTIGRTLYEIQEEKRQKSLHSHYERIIRSVDTGTSSTPTAFNPPGTCTLEPTTEEAESLKQDENSKDPTKQEKAETSHSQETIDGSATETVSAVVGTAEELSEEGSTSQHSKYMNSSTFSGSTSNQGSSQSLIMASASPATHEKKKRIFSPKKFVKSLVRRASNSALKSDSVQVEIKDSNVEPKDSNT